MIDTIKRRDNQGVVQLDFSYEDVRKALLELAITRECLSEEEIAHPHCLKNIKLVTRGNAAGTLEASLHIITDYEAFMAYRPEEDD